MQPVTTYFENGEMFAQFFLFNNEMNNAGDPINFKIYPENNAKIAKSFIGRPYLSPPKDAQGKWLNEHHRAENLNKLLLKQKKHALGEIVRTPYNPATGNHNAIVKVFPEHYDAFRKGLIPAATSPMFAQSDSFMDENGRLHIKDGMGVHLQGLAKGGYPPELSEIKSICEGGLNACMVELQTVAAAGQLLEFQNDESFSIEKNDDFQTTMSQQQAQAPPGGPPGMAPQGNDDGNRIAALEAGLAELTKQFQMILQKLGGAPAAPPAAAPPAMAGAAGEVAVVEEPEAVKVIRTELEALKADREVEMKAIEEQKLALFLKDRNRTATEIVESKIKLHKLPLEAKDVEIKKLVEMKDGENYIDLSLLHAEVTEYVKTLVGAAGTVQVHEIAELGVEGQKAETNYLSVMEKVGL